jgi:hypothetical protein
MEEPMTRIEYINDGVQVDAGMLAQAFAISAEDLRLGMREGAITSRFEQGEGEDAGKVRLTFFSADRRVRMIADERGSVLECSAVTFPLPRSPAAPGQRHEAGAGDASSGAADETFKDPHAAEEADAARRARLDAILDEALCDTFPASDPIAVRFPSAR